ncbi:MAG: RDD family protein [Chloroflexota bacterium]|nr:RDD family protein [Chloroflexota bacterium]
MIQEQAQASDVGVGFGERFVAYLVDVVILFVIDIVLRLVLGTPGALIGIIVGVSYFVGFWMTQGATPGKMLLGLKVVRQDGAPVDGSTALLRYVGYIVSSIPIGLGFLWIIWDPRHEGWHDKIAKTRVIKAA